MKQDLGMFNFRASRTFGRIKEGIAVGVASGIILSAFYWIIENAEHKRLREHQIRTLANIIKPYREPLLSPQRERFSPSDKKLFFDSLKNEVDIAMRERSSNLTYEEIDSIRGEFLTLTVAGYPRGKDSDNVFYKLLFKKLEELDWLDLPSSTP